MYILIVEDDARISRLVERALAGAGHRTDVVHDGADGLVRAESGAYDLVVLDVMLPGMDGTAVARQRARAASGRPSSCSRRATRCPTAWWGSTPAPTTT
jgi:DNA-binding response OmpR family regulator